MVFSNVSYYLCAKMGDFYEFYIMLYNVMSKDPSLTLRMTIYWFILVQKSRTK